MTPRRYTDEELIYSRSSRCKCGAGLAYPNNGDLRGMWRCSKVLKEGGTEDDESGNGDHDMARPFMFWSIKSEHQAVNDASNVTTRPGGKIDRERLKKVDS